MVGWNYTLDMSKLERDLTEKAVEATYSANDLTALEGLEAVRKRPGMYIGSTDSSGLNHLVWEIIDNSVDEALAGHAKNIEVFLNADGSVQVDDDGRGIPTGINSKSGLSGVELALTKLHAGGKFGGSGYKSAGGLHGVGSSVVNALSTRLDATVYQGNKRHDISFQRGVTGDFAGDGPSAKFTKGSQLKASPDKRSASEKKSRPTGTSIRWWSDPAIFLRDAKLDIEGILNRAKTTAFLVSGLRIVVNDLRDPQNTIREEFHFTGGLVDMVESLAPDGPVNSAVNISTTKSFSEMVPVLNDEGSTDMTEVEREVEIGVAFRWGTEYDYTLRSYVNVVNTPLGGTHVKGFERGVLKVINDQARARRGILKANDPNPILDDATEGLTAVVTVGFAEPQFVGQTKDSLGSSAITKLVQAAVEEEFGRWMNDKKNANASKTILEKVAKASEIRRTQREKKDLARKKSAIESASAMPPKHVECELVGHEFSELHLVEGDSALGSMRSARLSSTMALLPLRGKVLNVHKASMAQILANAELAAIIQVMGAGSGKTFDLDACRYNKIIIQTDADVDGGHIKSLLITFFVKYMRPFVEAGRLYASVPPLYSVKVHGKNEAIHYASDGAALAAITKELDKKKAKYDINRNKGLGEMPADSVWQTLLNPETRKLKQITLLDYDKAEKMLDLAMGADAEPRKDWIMNNRHKLPTEELDG